MCGLATDDQLKAALGEAPGAKERRDTDSLKACAVDGASGDFYLFLVLVRPSMGAAQQVAYDKNAAKDAKPIDAATYPFADSGEAYVETAQRRAGRAGVVRLLPGRRQRHRRARRRRTAAHALDAITKENVSGSSGSPPGPAGVPRQGPAYDESITIRLTDSRRARTGAS